MCDTYLCFPGCLEQQPCPMSTPDTSGIRPAEPAQAPRKRRRRDEADATAFARLMRCNQGVALVAGLVACASFGLACAAAAERCGPFAHEQLPAPVPSPYPSAMERAKSINQAIRSRRYSILFFGDSLTEGWDAAVWEKSLAPRGALNAGVSGDRTDNLLWRLQNGNLAGAPPTTAVLLIGP